MTRQPKANELTRMRRQAQSVRRAAQTPEESGSADVEIVMKYYYNDHHHHHHHHYHGDDDDDDDDDDPSSMITMVGAEPGEGHTEHGMSELQGLTIFFSVCECKPSF